MDLNLVLSFEKVQVVHGQNTLKCVFVLLKQRALMFDNCGVRCPRASQSCHRPCRASTARLQNKGMPLAQAAWLCWDALPHPLRTTLSLLWDTACADCPTPESLVDVRVKKTQTGRFPSAALPTLSLNHFSSPHPFSNP